MKFSEKKSRLGLMGLCVAACALALCLVGCGGQSASSSAAASSGSASEAAESSAAAASDEGSSAAAESGEASEAAESSADDVEPGTVTGDSEANDTVEVSKEFAQVNDIAKSIAESGIEDKTIDFNALPTREDEMAEVFKDFELGADGDAASRAVTGTTWLSAGGITMPIPGTWRVAKRTNEFVFENQNGRVAGHLAWVSKKPGASYDYMAMAKAIPAELCKQARTDVVVLDYGTVKSNRGTLCGAYVLYAAVLNGAEFCFYSEIIGSKTYINLVEFAGKTSDFKSELSAMQTATKAITFHSYEVV